MEDMQLAGAPVYRLSMIAEAYATKGRNTQTHTKPVIILCRISFLTCPHLLSVQSALMSTVLL